MIDLVAQREQIAAEIGLVKEKDGLEVRDKPREKIVKADFTRKARAAGSDPVFAEILAELLISRSVRIQLTKKPKDLVGKTALVVGGSGRMGAWFCRRLANRGARVLVWDPRGRLDGYDNAGSIVDSAKLADIIVVASPLGVCRDELESVLSCGPKGLVFDVCSVKSHIADQLRAAAKKGLKVTSVHPMFGPNVASPSGRNVVVCDCGNQKANTEASRLFSRAGAKIVKIPLEDHDRLMAYVLGLPHMSALVFASTLSSSGERLEDLAAVKGPSFDKMVTSARELTSESVRVYHDIQALNPNTRKMFNDVEKAFKQVRKAAVAKDPASFRKIVESDKRYLEVR